MNHIRFIVPTTLAAAFSVAVLAAPALAQDPQRPADSTPAPKPDDGVTINVLPQDVITPKLGDDLRVKQIGFVKGLRYLLPIKWTAEKPSNPMRLAQIRIPPLSNELHGDGLLVISAGIGGSVEDNVARWIAQFTETEGVPTQQDLQISGSPLLVTQVIATGTYNAGMPGQAPDLKPETTLWGAIVQNGPEGTVFFKAVGPKQTMAERTVAWDILIRNLKIQEKPRVLPTAPGRAPSEPPAEQPNPPAPSETPKSP